jgi:hypothetical protein
MKKFLFFLGRIISEASNLFAEVLNLRDSLLSTDYVQRELTALSTQHFSGKVTKQNSSPIPYSLLPAPRADC